MELEIARQIFDKVQERIKYVLKDDVLDVIEMQGLVSLDIMLQQAYGAGVFKR